MTKMILITALLLSTTQAFAKITTFNNADAAKLVLNDDVVMSKIIGDRRNGELKSVMVSSSQGGMMKNFAVRVTHGYETAHKKQVCYSDVNVGVIIKQVGLPTGGPGISTGKLVVKNVGKTICF